jgi:hypothetical protein
MPLTRTALLRTLKIAGAIIAIALIIGYAVWRSLNYVRGPDLFILEPQNGSAISSSTVIIRGRAERVNHLTLNGRVIPITEQGEFGQVLIVFPGLNIISFVASDQFGRSVTSELQLFGEKSLPAPRVME